MGPVGKHQGSLENRSAPLLPGLVHVTVTVPWKGAPSRKNKMKASASHYSTPPPPTPGGGMQSHGAWDHRRLRNNAW
jgi:hypothetical protein